MIDTLASGWTVHVLGAIGFSAYLLSPLLPSRRALLITDAVAMLPIAAHYVLLGGAMGAWMSVVYLAADMIGLASARGRLWLGALALLAAGLCAVFWQGPADLAALAGTMGFLLSRYVDRHRDTLILAALGTMVWGYYGHVTGSISQQIFTIIYVIACAIRIYRLR